MYMQNYKDILVYKTYRINLDNKLEAYNIFDNTRTYMRACKAIDEYLKTVQIIYKKSQNLFTTLKNCCIIIYVIILENELQEGNAQPSMGWSRD